ncbi:CLUMA_CG011292, isoform A [Clunio marinus]|uniref:CLUMA_CG011292, isoform A n=1 Tax=Clunio marinus TaxID=568069 RepID=A0A1J1ICA4_9DIPT|nr:CLUMA_CG011292, isoform A [Clunio marinus]
MTETLLTNHSNHVVVPAKLPDKSQERPVEHIEPPDGGIRAYLVMVCAFLCNGIIFGIINTYSVIYLSLQRQLKDSGDEAASSKASLVGSLTIGATFLFSPISGILVDKLGLRTTTFIGGLLTTSGMFLSSYFVDEPFNPDNVTMLCLTYGIMFGTGAALAYTPTLAILGHYFKRYLGVVNGLVTAGSSVFTALLPGALTYIEINYGLKKCLITLTFLSSFIILCAIVYKPLQPPPPPKEKKSGRSQCYNVTRSVINFDNWKKKKYIIWAISIPIALFGYFVPYVHISKFITEKFPENNQNLPLICIGITSGLGRIIFGMISDLPGVNRIFLQQISFYFIGMMTMCLPITGNYSVLLVICLTLGLFDGCFISLLGPIAYDICGPHGAAQAIGFLLGLCSFGLTSGPPLAGKMFDKTQSYKWPFIIAGIPPIVGATFMFLTRYVKDDVRRKNEDKELQPFQNIPQLAWEKENNNKTVDGNRKATLAGPDE